MDNPASSSSSAIPIQDHITEDEASLYDRQIRLWGLEAQNRMRNSTVLVISLRGLAHEAIKNLVLAGIGRLIALDEGKVTEEDLGHGFLFREDEGAVGMRRTDAALPQIQSLNPLVNVTAIPAVSPFVVEETSSAGEQGEDEAIDFLRKEKVDVVVACDLPKAQMSHIDSLARKAGSMFYAACTYGFYGYIYADLGDRYDYAQTPAATNPNKALVKLMAQYCSMDTAFTTADPKGSIDQSTKHHSPFRGLSQQQTKDVVPGTAVAILALWEFERANNTLPQGSSEDEAALNSLAEAIWKPLGINPRAFDRVGPELIQHLAQMSRFMFPPTLAIVGGLLAQDVLRAISRRDKPIVNMMTVATMEGTAVVSRWGMGDATKVAADDV